MARSMAAEAEAARQARAKVKYNKNRMTLHFL